MTQKVLSPFRCKVLILWEEINFFFLIETYLSKLEQLKAAEILYNF